MARLGEDIAAHVAGKIGLVVERRNLTVGRGEIDVVVSDGRHRIAVEVKTSTTDLVDAVDRFDQAKHDQVIELAGRAGCDRVDCVAVYLGPEGYYVRWMPNVV